MNSSVIRATWPRQSVVPLPYSLSPWRRGERRRKKRGWKSGGGEECVAHILSLFSVCASCKLCTEPSTSNEETVVLHYTTRVEREHVLQYTSLSEGKTEDCISTITTQSHKQNLINQFRNMSQATPTELTLNFLYSVIHCLVLYFTSWP